MNAVSEVLDAGFLYRKIHDSSFTFSSRERQSEGYTGYEPLFSYLSSPHLWTLLAVSFGEQKLFIFLYSYLS